MPRENLEVVRRMYAAFHGGDAQGALACFAPDVVVDASVRPDGATGRGREDVVRIIGGWVAAWDGWSEEIEEMRESADRVYVVATQRGRAKGSGIPAETRYALVYEVDRGQITRMTLYTDPAEARAAAGLPS